MAVIANVALTNTFDTWRLRTNVGFTRLNAFAIDESSLYANTLTANVAFTSKGLGTFQGRATVGTNLTVSGNTTLGAANKTITTTGLISHTGRVTISTNLAVSGNVSVTGISTFSDAAQFNGAVTLGDAATDLTTINGRATIAQNLNVSGNTTVGAAGKTTNATGWFGVNGRASVSTNLFVGGNTTIGGALNIMGAINLGDASTDLLTVTGRATIGTNLTVSGNTILGAANKTITTTGLLDHTGRATISTNLTVSGNTTLNGTTTDNSNALNQTLTDGATINWDVALGRVATVTLGDNRTMAAPTNLKVGTYILNVIQDGTGGRTITWNSVFKWTAGVAPPLTTAANRRDIFSFFSDGTNLYGSFMPDVR